jgi:hypothetical protein
VRVSIALTVIANLVVLLRLWTRLFHIKKPGYDDLCIFFAIIICTAYTVIVKVQTEHGLGIHSNQIEGDDQIIWLKVMNIRVTIL